MALASEITTRVQSSLGDINKVRYPDAELLKFLGDGMRFIVQIFPAALVERLLFDVVAGSARQTLVEPAWKLIRVDSNYNGTGEGHYIPLVEMNELDSMQSDWRAYVPSVAKQPAAADGRYYSAYAHDPQEPAVFYLYPQGLADRDVYILASIMPEEPTAIGDTLDLADQYIPPMTDYVIYRAMLKEGRFAMDPALAQTYWDHFVTSMSAINGVRKQDVPQSYRPPEGP